MYKKVVFGLLLLCSCKSAKQEVQQITRLPLREDGFYYTKNHEYTTDEYLLLKFYNNGHISELTVGDGMNEINTNFQLLPCLLDTTVDKPKTIPYRMKGDSIFFQKNTWDSYELSTLFFACKAHGDSIVARITPIDYHDTLNIKPNKPLKSYTATYKFKQALCDTAFLRKMPNIRNQK